VCCGCIADFNRMCKRRVLVCIGGCSGTSCRVAAAVAQMHMRADMVAGTGGWRSSLWNIMSGMVTVLADAAAAAVDALRALASPTIRSADASMI
jgi:hypothetical protein